MAYVDYVSRRLRVYDLRIAPLLILEALSFLETILELTSLEELNVNHEAASNRFPLYFLR